jgi:class 3 adenylate cyclase/predicted ATPase
MTFEELLDQVLVMLQRRGRVSYRTLTRQFALDEANLEDLKEAILFAHPQVVDEAGRGLVWTGDAGAVPLPAPAPPQSVDQPVTPLPRPGQTALPSPEPYTSDAERRQLTVLFCDLVDSTGLARQLDPEELREVVRAYQDTCAKVIARFEGHIAQYLGDGLLVYFGYPLAHEDDAQRAVRAGLGMIDALGQLNTHLEQEREVHLTVRLGIHTGLVVVGEVGGGTRQEQLALGATPNLAARLQGIATPDTLVISAATFQLLGGFFACQPLGTPLLKGFAQPLAVYRVLYESMARSRLEALGSTGLTPLVGREQEVRLLLERWVHVKEGVGQVVLLSGEAGIGKSRLVQVLTEHVAAEPQAWLTPCQCSPYHQNTALYPWIELLERVVLRFEREESPAQKLSKLEGFLAQYGLPLVETVPLFATLLSLPQPAAYVPLLVSPEQQKQQTLRTLLAILLRIAAQQPVLLVMEDLHWADPSTLELLTLLVDQGPTACILVLLTFRPDFSPPWTGRSHLTQVTVTRLPSRQAVEVIRQVAHGKALPPEVVEQVVAKTDGVPLFVEELTKMVLESGLLQEQEDRYTLTGPLPPLAIPATLHDSLMARLDRLATVKAIAQLGATLGREFAYDLLQAVSPWNEETVQRGLSQLVEAEFLYQQGLPPHATYAFKHVLIQEAAYQSLLRSTRQRHHQHIAQVLEARFPALCATQPELLAHHYTEAGFLVQAMPYWQQAGTRAIQRSANVEAIAHVQRGLALLAALPDTPQRIQHELDFLTTLGPALSATKGYAAPDVVQVYTRARELCHQVGETPEHFPVLWNLYVLSLARAEHTTAMELGEQCLQLAQRVQDEAFLLTAHLAIGVSWFYLGNPTLACTHLEHTVTLYDPTQHHVLAYQYGAMDPGIVGFGYYIWALWMRGYVEQARAQSAKALNLAQQLAHPYTLARTLYYDTVLCQLRRDAPAVCAQADAAITVATTQRFALVQALGPIMRGWAIAVQQHSAEGLIQIRQGLDAYRATGAEYQRPHFLTLLAETAGLLGQSESGLAALEEALTLVEQTGEQYYAAELHRQRGELLLLRAAQRHLAQGSREQHEAEACFQQALDIARHQQAKSLELRADMSLARLWQRQGKRAEAHALLAPIYGWFTEGFDTADLQEAKALLVELQR